MPARAKPVPPGLGDVFLTRDLAGHGASRGRARRSDLDKSVRGVRSFGAAPVLIRRCRSFQLRLPEDAFFSHGTAALLLGAPVPWHVELAAELSVTVPAPRRAPHANGITGHSREVTSGDVGTTAGIHHSSPARLWCELAGALDLGDLVALGDYLVHRGRRLSDIATLGRRLLVGDRISRSPLLRRALPLLSDRSESRPESRLRVILHLGELPTPEINHEIVMTDDGGRLRPDFTFSAQRVILEYQGDYHRTRDQWRKDMTRRSRLEASGWRVHELNADDLRDPRELCARVRRLLRL